MWRQLWSAGLRQQEKPSRRHQKHRIVRDPVHHQPNDTGPSSNGQTRVSEQTTKHTHKQIALIIFIISQQMPIVLTTCFSSLHCQSKLLKWRRVWCCCFAFRGSSKRAGQGSQSERTSATNGTGRRETLQKEARPAQVRRSPQGWQWPNVECTTFSA